MKHNQYERIASRIKRVTSRPMIIPGFDDIASYTEAIEHADDNKTKLELGSGAACRFGLPGLVVFLKSYANYLEAMIKDEGDVGMELTDIYAWALAIQKLLERNPNNAMQDTKKAIEECKKIRERFTKQLELETGSSAKRWTDTAKVYANRLLKDCISDYDVRQKETETQSITRK